MRIIARIDARYIAETGALLNTHKVKFSCAAIENSYDLLFIIDNVKYPFMSGEYLSFGVDAVTLIEMRHVKYISVFN